MRRFILILCVISMIGLGGCSDNRAQELFETAQLEEKQNSPDHAGQLYREIMEKYPDSKFAPMARERLSELNKE